MITAASYLKSIPRKSFVGFLLGVFLIFTTTGFAIDMMGMGRQQSVRFVLAVLVIGVFAVSYALAGFILRKQSWKAFLPLFALEVLLMSLLGNRFPDLPQPIPMGSADIDRLQTRLMFDGIATMFAIGLGYACFLYVSIAEGRRYARVHAEMVLAAEVHRVLVPGIDAKIKGFEFYGRSVPSSEVGGDLIDVFQQDRRWVAYIADVSGHGVAPGVVMAMVKSAARMQLSSDEKSAALLERLNAVLHPIKKPEVFVTFAYLAWNGEQLEYSSAGHPPILHYHAATKEVSELACSNLPVGMFREKEFQSGSASWAPNDLFLLLTDGLLEVTNSKDEEFGLDGIKAVLSEHGAHPQAEILEAILDAANRHGHAADDRSLLLVRCTK